MHVATRAKGFYNTYVAIVNYICSCTSGVTDIVQIYNTPTANDRKALLSYCQRPMLHALYCRD
jgi:hypothetical protein